MLMDIALDYAHIFLDYVIIAARTILPSSSHSAIVEAIVV